MIKINMSTKLAYTILALLGLIIIILIGVNAYPYLNPIPNPGHGADKIWIDMLGPNPNSGEQNLQDAISNGSLRNMPRVSTYSTNPLGTHDACFLQDFEEEDHDRTECAVTGTPGGTWSLSASRTVCIVMCLDWYPLNS